MSPRSLLKAASAPLRSFFNQRFADMQRRMEVNEEHLTRALDELTRQSRDLAEMQQALLDSITLLGSSVAELRSRTLSDATGVGEPEPTVSSAQQGNDTESVSR